MKLDEGHVYILNDVDDITGPSDYYKIGMVSKERTVKDRIERDHQVGNPRLVVDKHSFHSEAPFFVERHLHKHFAQFRVRREWFRLTDAQLEEVKKEAARYDSVIGPMLGGVRAFAKSPSNGNVIKLEAKDKVRIELLHSELEKLRYRIYEIDYKTNTIKEFLKFETAKHKGGIDGITKVTVKGGGAPSFKATIFRDSSPANKAIYDSFCTKKSISGPFKTEGLDTKAKKFPKLHLVEKAAKDKYAADKATNDNVVDGAIPRTKTLEDKHKEYIELIMEKEDVNVEIILRELEIKKLCANNDGIEEICTWKRQESFAFDATAFKNRHPEIVEDPQYHSASKPSVAISVIASRDYV